MEGKPLDDLLQSVLEDFDRPVLLPSERRAHEAKLAAEKKEREASAAAMHDFPDSPSGFGTERALNDDDFMAQNTKEIEESLRLIAEEDPSLAQQLKSLTEMASGVASSDEETALKNFKEFATMFKNTLDNVSVSNGVTSEDLLDDDLKDLMGSFSNLGVGKDSENSSPNSPPPPVSPQSFGNKIGAVNNALRPFLAKELMYPSLKQCLQEYEPWLRENQTQLSVDQRDRFAAQVVAVRKIIHHYDDEPSPVSDAHFQQLMELIGELQDLGDFPEGLMAKIGNQQQVFPKTGEDLDQNSVPDCKVS